MVYVDDMKARYGRMVMCHMVADTSEELNQMADRIGVARKWSQGDHYDICMAKRAAAVRLGAIEITRREAAKIRRRMVMRMLGAAIVALACDGEK